MEKRMPSLTSQREKFPWARDISQPGVYTADRRVTELVKKLSIRTTFGIGGVRGVSTQSDQDAQENARKLLGRAMAIDCTLFLDKRVKDLVSMPLPKPVSGDVKRLLTSPKRGYQKPLSEPEAKEFNSLQHAFKDASIASVYAQFLMPFGTVAAGVDLTTLLMDPVVRRLLWVEDTTITTALLQPQSKQVLDRWFRKAVPATLFSLRFLDSQSHRIDFASSSIRQLDGFLTRILPHTTPNGEQESSVYLHVASIDRKCLLVPPQEKRLQGIPDLDTEELGSLASPTFLYTARPVLVAALEPDRRDAVLPPSDTPPSGAQLSEFRTAREEFRNDYTYTAETYESTLISIALDLLAQRELNRKRRGEAIAEGIATLEKQNLYESEKGDSRTLLEQFSDILDETAEFLKETGSYIIDLSSKSLGSRLNLLSAVEREIQAGPYVDYLEKVWDVLVWCNRYGMFNSWDANTKDASDRALEVLRLLSHPNLLGRDFITRPMSEIRDAIQASLGFQTKLNSNLQNITFCVILKVIGGIQEFTGEYFRTGKWPGKSLHGGLCSFPINLWRFYLEIEYILGDATVGYMTQETDVGKRSLITFIPKHIGKLGGTGLVDLPKSLIGDITGGFKDLETEIANAIKSSDLTKSKLLLAIKEQDWYQILPLLCERLVYKQAVADKKQETGSKGDGASG